MHFNSHDTLPLDEIWCYRLRVVSFTLSSLRVASPPGMLLLLGTWGRSRLAAAWAQRPALAPEHPAWMISSKSHLLS